MVSVIIVAAGSGTRSGLKQNKVFFKLGKSTVIESTAAVFLSNDKVSEVIIAANKNELDFMRGLFINESKVSVVEGGETRTASVQNALNCVKNDIVLIHDGARPFLSEKLVDNCIDDVIKFGSSICAIPSKDTLARLDGENIFDSFKGYLIQTPQGFLTKEIKGCYAKLDGTFSDDSSVYLKYLKPPHLTCGEEENIKLTYKTDFERITSNSNALLVGTGFDLHRLVENRKLILGGVEIPHTKGLLGHSDADALTHAIMDAMLSALSLGDIGKHFPDNDQKYKDICSMTLLEKVLGLINEKGYKVHNLSACILAEKPKLAPFVISIRESLSAALKIDCDKVGITCTTLEGIGIVGREEGIACQAYISLEKI